MAAQSTMKSAGITPMSGCYAGSALMTNSEHCSGGGIEHQDGGTHAAKRVSSESCDLLRSVLSQRFSQTFGKPILPHECVPPIPNRTSTIEPDSTQGKSEACIAYTFLDTVCVTNSFPNISTLDYSFRRKMVYQEILAEYLLYMINLGRYIFLG